LGRTGFTRVVVVLALFLMWLGVGGVGSGRAGTSVLATETNDDGCSLSLPVHTVVGLAATPDGRGYWIADSRGAVAACGNAADFGSLGSAPNSPVVGIVATPDGAGYWLLASDGGVFTFGDAGFFGSTGGLRLNEPVVGMASTSDGAGYWLVARDGGVFAFGDAQFRGSTGSIHLNRPVVGMAADPVTGGYWLVASDGGVFSFDAPFLGSMGGTPLNQPVVGMATTSTASGYWLVASDGGIFAFDAPFLGSTGGLRLNEPVVGMEAAGSAPGYRMVAADGGIFDFDQTFVGSAVAPESNSPACWVGLANPSPPQDAMDAAIVASDLPGSAVVATISGNGSATTDESITGADGNASLSFEVGTASPGTTEQVDISFENVAAQCSTSLTVGVPLPAVALTPDGTGDIYSRSGSGNVVITAPETGGGDEREVFWGANSPDEPDSTVCGTFSSGQGFSQQGLALRLNDSNGVVTGITVTRNVFGYDFHAFNFDVWNTADKSQPFTPFGQTVLPFLPQWPPVYPLSMCARTVTASNLVEFVVWVAGQSQPPWGDAGQGGEAIIPTGTLPSGHGGFYGGHVAPGTSMSYTGLTIDGQTLS
jgi:hypothetical protein